MSRVSWSDLVAGCVRVEPVDSHVGNSMVEQKAAAVESYEAYAVESYTVSKRGGIHRFRTRAEASLWYGCDVAEVDGIREGMNSVLVWRGADGVTYGSGEGLLPPKGVSYERAKAVRSEVRNHCKYKWEDTWESIFFEPPKSWVPSESYWRFTSMEEARKVNELPGLRLQVTPSLEEPSHVLVWGLNEKGEETANLYSSPHTLVISGRGDLPSRDIWVGMSLEGLLTYGFHPKAKVKGNVEALWTRSYRVGNRRFETIEEAELYLSKYPGKGTGKGTIVKSGAAPNSYLPPNSDGWAPRHLPESYNPHTAVEVCLARGEADWVGHLRSQLTAEVTGMLEGAGFVVRMVSTNPFHMVGGVSLSEGDPKVYSGGFAIVEKDGCFVISSTSSWGRLLNETSHATPQGAAKALIQAFQDTKDFDAMDRAIEAGDKVASVNNKATSTEVSVISPCVSYGKVAGPEVPGAAVPRFRTLGEAEIWYGEGGAGLVEGEVDSILVWRGGDGVTYGSGDGLLPPWGADMECVPLGVSGLHPHHYRYDWGGGEESIFFERPKSWYMQVEGPKFATREEVECHYRGVLAYLNKKPKPSLDEPTHVLVWSLRDGVEVGMYARRSDTLVISGKGALPSAFVHTVMLLKHLPALRLGLNVKVSGNVEAMLARSYRVGDLRFQRRNEAELYLSRNPSLGKEVTPCGLDWNSYLSWTEGGEVKDSTRGMLPPGDFHLNQMGDPHHRHKEKPILLRSDRAKKEEELRNSLAEELAERATRTSEDISATPKEVDWFWAVWGLLTLGGVLWRGQQSKGTALGSRVAAQLSAGGEEPTEEEIVCNTAEVTSRR